MVLSKNFLQTERLATRTYQKRNIGNYLVLFELIWYIRGLIHFDETLSDIFYDHKGHLVLSKFCLQTERSATRTYQQNK